MTSGDLAARKLARTAFIVRMVAAIAIHVLLPEFSLAPDEQTYHIRGDYLARYWRGEIPIDPSTQYLGEGRIYYFVIAALYFPFGPIPLLPKLLNAWIGSRAVLELFLLTRLLGGSEPAAFRAAKFMAFFPSMILWSSLMVRDVWVQWLLVRLAREMAELKGRFIPSRIITVGLFIWGLTLFRSYLLYAAVGPFVLAFVLSRSKDIVRNLAVGSALLLALSYLGVREGNAGKAQVFDLEEMQRLRSWSASEAAAESGFARDADISTTSGVVALLPVALLHFFFAPFPWQIGSTARMMAIPETMYFYTFVPGIIAGVGFLFRRRFADSIGVLLMTMTVTFGYAIGQGNVGTLYRHKAQVIGFYYAFAAIGMESRRRKGVAPSYPAYPVNPREPARPRTPAYDGFARES
jgi:hypothetical protein